MRTKHYPNIYRMRVQNRKLVGAINALDLHGIAAKTILLTPSGTPVIELHDCPHNYKLHGVQSGVGTDKYGAYIRKEATLNGCKLTWTEEKIA